MINAGRKPFVFFTLCPYCFCDCRVDLFAKLEYVILIHRIGVEGDGVDTVLNYCHGLFLADKGGKKLEGAEVGKCLDELNSVERTVGSALGTGINDVCVAGGDEVFTAGVKVGIDRII